MKKQTEPTDINPVVKKWLEVLLRVLVIILSAFFGDATGIINTLNF